MRVPDRSPNTGKRDIWPMVRVLHISDTHLSPRKPHFEPNWAPLRAWIDAQKPDLILHGGDVTVDGAGDEDDFRYCAELFASLPAPVLAVPGNHDVGEPRHLHQPVDAERLGRWRRYLGRDYWSRDIESWCLIGLNSQLFGSGEADEARQLAWLEATMAAAGGRRIAWFLHMPLFLDDPAEGDMGYWTVKPEPRAPLLDLVAGYKVALVASGHVHRSHDCHRDGTRYVWVPSSGFVVGPAMQPAMAGESRLGAVVYRFEGSSVDVEITDVEGLMAYRIDDVIHEVYPPREAA
jgi:3',5'-cyclic AMP phosphodiesterase CpdA